MAVAISVRLNGRHVVTVSTDGVHLVRVDVHGDRLGPELAHFDVNAMRNGDEGEKNTHLWWAEREELRAGDLLEVELLADAPTSRKGTTFEEAYPDYEEKHGPPPPREQLLEELASRPYAHEALRFTLMDASGEAHAGGTLASEHGFGFGVTWIWLHPEYAKVSLHCYDLGFLAQNNDSRDIARFRLEPGQKVQFRIE